MDNKAIMIQTQSRGALLNPDFIRSCWTDSDVLGRCVQREDFVEMVYELYSLFEMSRTVRHYFCSRYTPELEVAPRELALERYEALLELAIPSPRWPRPEWIKSW